MKRLRSHIIGHPKLFITLHLIVTLVFLYYGLDLEIHDDILNYLPDNEPVVETFNEIGDTFNGNEVGVVIVEGEDVFTNEALAHIDRLTDEFLKVDGVASVTSLTNVMDMRGDEGMLHVDRLVEKDRVYSPEELASLRDYVMDKDLYRGNLVTEDGRYSLIMIKLQPEAESKQVVEDLREALFANEGSYNHYLTGTPFISNYADRSAKGDLRRFMPTIVLLVVLVLFFTFGSLKGVLLPLAAVVISVIWTMGLMVMVGRELSTVGISIPVILIALGSAYGIHAMNEYYGCVRGEETKKEDLIRAMDQVGAPLLLSALTTMVGFASLTTAELTPIKEFGTFTAFGVFAACVTAYSFIFPVLALLPYRPQRLKENGSNRFEHLADWIFPRRKGIVAVVSGIVLICLFLIPTLRFDTDYANAFRAGAPAKAAIDLANEQFGGVSILQLPVEGDLRSPFVLSQMKALSQSLEELGINNVMSYADLIQEANKTINELDELPATRDQVASLGLFLEGQEQVQSYVTPDYSQGLIVGRFTKTSSKEMAKINQQVRELLAELDCHAYVIPKDSPDEELSWLAEAILTDQVTDKLRAGPWEGSAPSAEDLRDLVDELAAFTFPRFLYEDLDMIDELAADCLSYLPLTEGTHQRVLETLFGGAGVDDLADVLIDLNPELDPFDLEDEAYLLWDELQWAYEDAKLERLEEAEAKLEEWGIGLSPAAVSGILTQAWAGEVYTTSAPDNLKGTLAEDSFTIELSGAPVIYEVVTERLQRSQFISLLLSLVLVSLLLMAQTGSVIRGLTACAPVMMTVLINFGVMAIRDIPLDVATTMIASVAIGTGIDYSIHFVSRYRKAISESGNVPHSLRRTLGSIGTAISSNALAVAAGFLVLVLSSTVTVAFFGGLTAFTMVISAILTLVYLPALFTLVESRQQERSR
ncbi:MAG: efflux RND transporter permease subunit [Limnochordia bacterium]|jgi:predicted RND superfamily exporter protein